jgi:hypothetical protein
MPVQSETGSQVPKSGERPHKPGLYLELLHGRNFPNQPMNGWGFDGPMIGPLNWCHTIYATTIRIDFQCAEDERLYFQDVCFPDARDMRIHDDLLVYDGRYFGDWTVFHVEPVAAKIAAMPKDTFRSVRRRGEQPRA